MSRILDLSQFFSDEYSDFCTTNSFVFNILEFLKQKLQRILSKMNT